MAFLRHGTAYAVTGRGRNVGSGAGTPEASIYLSASTVAEDAAIGAVVGTLGASNATGTPTFTLEDDAGGLFSLVGAQVIVASALDYEVATTHDIVVSATGLTPAAPNTTLTIIVTNVDDFPVNTVIPAITGSTAAGQTLTASTGTWTGTPTPTYIYLWHRDAVPIGGATASTYVLTAGDTGHTIKVLVHAQNNAGAASAFSASTAVVGSAPVMTLSANTIAENAASPTTIGTLSVGSATGTPVFALVTNPGGLFAIVGNALRGIGSFDYETTTSYDVTVSVSGITPSLSNQTFTINVTDVDDAPFSTVSPVASVSTLQVGQTVSTTNGTWSGDQNLTFAYQWYAQASLIPGATNSTYVLTSAELGKYISAYVMATNTAGSSADNSNALGFFTGGVQPAEPGSGGSSSGLLLLLTNSTGVPGGSSYSVTATQFFDRITDPGTTRKDLYAAMIDGMVLDGTWDLIGGLYILAADIAGNALVNLKGATGNLTATGSPTFTADRGYTFSNQALTQYLDTGTTYAALGLSQNSSHLGVVRGTGGTQQISLWGRATTNGRYSLTNTSPAINGTFQYRLGTSSATTASAHLASVTTGHMIATRTGGSAISTYEAGTLLQTNTTASESNGSDNAWIGGGQSGSGNSCDCRIDAAHCGAGLNDAQANQIYTRMRTYLLAVGSQI